MFIETRLYSVPVCCLCTQVAHMWHMGNSMTTDTAAADALTRALCQCRLLEELKLSYLYLGCVFVLV